MNAPNYDPVHPAEALVPQSRFRLLSLPQRRAASFASAVAAGLIGSREVSFAATLPTMSWRFDCRDVTAAQLLALHRRHRRGKIDVAVMVHGLMIDESCWTGAVNPFVEDLEGLFGWTPLFVRYNTGLHISENGAALAELLSELHAVWGAALGRVQLFGHSMGGLVSRSAVEALRVQEHPVLEHIDRMFLICTPNGGVEVEQLRFGIENGLRILQQLAPQWIERLIPEGRAGNRLQAMATRSLRRLITDAAGFVPRAVASAGLWFVAFPSDGIRDVRFGYMQQREWEAHREGELAFMTNHRRPLPPPKHVRAYAIAASLWPSSTDVPSRVRNDGIVTVASVAAQTLDFDDLGVVSAGRFAELPLLVHQAAPVSHRVADRIEAWVIDGC